ncbi:hypothetical protein DDB_G0285567 [Dictyostelium discoideum AX4]|uniref:Uncharacterized protein n=1 Tax=Dictyostelium discoideum TaxID=44689 RepID=Q54N13_DICDI|nr:hypothetical protein DDB_G0285567 [Dictyostelium discoideum AX4]EAL64621.1 hypothetical protein DDB_G0285567 [Dictyostelium discoideum AX4]|eukprot:XP_638130.1 hypothetical protein DDB_G0285567 [Dictyostelium discoideum AX4]
MTLFSSLSSLSTGSLKSSVSSIETGSSSGSFGSNETSGWGYHHWNSCHPCPPPRPICRPCPPCRPEPRCHYKY